jgi:triacylglycerol lipase
MKSRFQMTTIMAVCLALLTACAGISGAELQSLGSKLTPAHINFSELGMYAERSRIAYGAEAAIKSKYPRTIRIKVLDKTGVRYFLERDDRAQTQIITVRGSANNTNFFEDLDVSLHEDPQADIPVHAGFDRVARAIYSDVKPHLKAGYKTYLTGHSLGGAVAVLVTIYTIKDGHRVEQVTTFGQPRFTTAAGVKRLGALPLMRVVDENDMVSMLPPATAMHPLYGPYEHVGPEVILLQGPRYTYLSGHDANRIAIGEFWRSVGTANLEDHHMDNYVKRIAEKTAGSVAVPYNQREQYVAEQTKFATVPN